MEVARARALLGVGHDASFADVRAAYRTQLLRHHPDGGGSGDPAAIGAIRGAYRTVVERGVAAGVEAVPPRTHVDVYA